MNDQFEKFVSSLDDKHFMIDEDKNVIRKMAEQLQSMQSRLDDQATTIRRQRQLIEDAIPNAELATKLEYEIDRLKSGKFTPEEWNNLCHETDKPMPLEQFAACCIEYQAKLYGSAVVEKYHESILGEERRKVREMYAKLCGFLTRLRAITGDMDNYVVTEACEFVGKELARKKSS